VVKLYLVHCGFYDLDLAEGIFEAHTNFFVAATSFEEARLKAKQLDDFKFRKMHVDGMQEINVVSGYRIHLDRDRSISESETHITSNRHRDLAKNMESMTST
jgi:hypothetical protein